MNVESLEELLQQLNCGDGDAAEQVFRTYEPYLRKVVRRMLPDRLRPKFDSIDVVQSVWADLFTAFRAGGMRFGSVPQLRAFLVRATRNRFIDRLRQHQTASLREQPAEPRQLESLASARQPDPSEVMVAEELWERMLRHCPTEHQELLHLSRQGATASEIASQIGMHAGSVRRILRELAIRLACNPTHVSEAKTS